MSCRTAPKCPCQTTLVNNRCPYGCDAFKKPHARRIQAQAITKRLTRAATSRTTMVTRKEAAAGLERAMPGAMDVSKRRMFGSFVGDFARVRRS